MPQLPDTSFDTTTGQKAHGWWQVLLTGLSFYCLGLVVLIVTENPNIFPTVVMLTVVVLHGLWDGLPGLLATVVRADFDIFIAEMSIGATGLLILWHRWQEAVRLQDRQLEETQTL